MPRNFSSRNIFSSKYKTPNRAKNCQSLPKFTKFGKFRKTHKKKTKGIFIPLWSIRAMAGFHCTFMRTEWRRNMPGKCWSGVDKCSGVYPHVIIIIFYVNWKNSCLKPTEVWTKWMNVCMLWIFTFDTRETDNLRAIWLWLTLSAIWFITTLSGFSIS